MNGGDALLGWLYKCIFNVREDDINYLAFLSCVTETIEMTLKTAFCFFVHEIGANAKLSQKGLLAFINLKLFLINDLFFILLLIGHILDLSL